MVAAAIVGGLRVPPGIRCGAASKQALSASRSSTTRGTRTPRRTGAGRTGTSITTGRPLLSTRYFPSRGLYSSSNAKIVAAQMREIAAAGVGTIVVSWWGFDSPENDRLAPVVQAAAQQGLDVAIHVEPYPRPHAGKAAEDIARLHEEQRLHGLLRLRRRSRSRGGVGGGARAARRRARLRTHAARRPSEGVRLRRPLHLRRRHVERRALPAAVHAGARSRAALRALRRPRVRRAARDAPGVRAARATTG